MTYIEESKADGLRDFLVLTEAMIFFRLKSRIFSSQIVFDDDYSNIIMPS